MEYDGPRVYSCRSLTDQLYVVGWAENANLFDLWLYVPVSAARMRMIRSGGLSLRSAYERPEGPLYLARVPHDPNAFETVETIHPSQLQEDWLPEADFKLRLPTPTLPAAAPVSEIARRAVQEGRTRLRIELESPYRLRSEASTRRVAGLLRATQNVLDNIGLVELNAEPAQDGRFAKEVVQRMDTDVLELTAASFVIELGSADGEDLLGDSPIGAVTERLVSLVSPRNEAEELWELVSDLKPRAAKSLRAFVNELAAFGADVTMATASRARDLTVSSLTANDVVTLQGILRQIVPDEIRQIRGRMVLYSGDYEDRRFGLRDLLDEEAFEGRVGERAIDQVRHATLGDVYDVVLSEYVTLERGIGATTHKFVLEQLVASEDRTPIERTTEVLSNTSSGDLGFW